MVAMPPNQSLNPTLTPPVGSVLIPHLLRGGVRAG